MSRLMLLVEEKSMQIFLDGLLPRLYPGLEFQCVPHEGKSDLAKSIPRKLRAWIEPSARFVILHDQDANDCRDLKNDLRLLCRKGGRDDAIVRIVCRELEAWYLGDPDALAEAFSKDQLRRLRRQARFRDPDFVVNPSKEILRLVPEFQKLGGARLMASRIARERNVSRSFKTFLASLDGLVDK